MITSFSSSKCNTKLPAGKTSRTELCQQIIWPGFDWFISLVFLYYMHILVVSNIHSTDYSFNSKLLCLLTCAVMETAPLITLFENKSDFSCERFLFEPYYKK